MPEPPEVLGPMASRGIASGLGEHSLGPPMNGRAGQGPTSPPKIRREILVHLRKSGPTSPDGLAAELGASRTGVLQQLHALEEAGLVRHVAEKHGVGRPRHLYDVTPDAQELFPADYGGFAVGLIAAIEDTGGASLVEEVFAARRRQIGERIRRRLADRLPESASLEEVVRELAVIQDEAGYIAEALVDDEGTIRLREHNCAIYQVSKDTRAACEAEIRLFREVLGVEVVRESHIAAGDRCCTYRIEEKATSPTN
jgi:predicted ArsR family transcriptional regulator